MGNPHTTTHRPAGGPPPPGPPGEADSTARAAAQLRQRLDNLVRSLPHMNGSDRFAAEGQIAQINDELRRLEG